MVTTNLFNICKKKIKKFIEEDPSVDVGQSYRFLNCPENRLKNNNGICFLGLNPHGEKKSKDKDFQTPYNVYATNPDGEPQEGWGKKGEFNNLQKQVRKFFEKINNEEKLEESFETLIENTLTGNLIPFRTPGAKDIKSEWYVFAVDLWKTIFAENSFEIIISNGNNKKTFNHLKRLIGYNQKHESVSLGNRWCKIKYIDVKGQTLLIGLPHLSRFSFANKQKYNHVFGKIGPKIKSHFIE